MTVAGPVGTTILVATRDRPELLRECLDSLLETGLERAEVLVLDQSSDAASEAVVRTIASGAAPIRRLALERPGKSRALNAGIARAAGTRIALTDDDCVVAPDWLRAIDREFEAAGGDRRVIIAGRVLPGRNAPDGSPPPSCITDPEPHDWSGRVGREVVYQNWAAPREVFERVGGFDEHLGPGTPFASAEDNDMAYRWLRAGYRVLYRPAVTVWHNGWRRKEDLYGLKWAYGLGQGAFYAKHFCRGDGHLAVRFLGDAARLARHTAGSLLRGDPRSARASVTLLAGLLAGAARMAPQAVAERVSTTTARPRD